MIQLKCLNSNSFLNLKNIILYADDIRLNMDHSFKTYKYAQYNLISEKIKKIYTHRKFLP